MNNLLPGAHDTDRIKSLNSAEVEKRGITMDQAMAERANAIPTKRIGTPAEFATHLPELGGSVVIALKLIGPSIGSTDSPRTPPGRTLICSRWGTRWFARC